MSQAWQHELEIHSGAMPRQSRPEHSMTKRSYTEAVLAGINAAAAATGTDCRLLLSIDRRESEAAAIETVELAAELMPHGVVGIDLSGARCKPRLGAQSRPVSV